VEKFSPTQVAYATAKLGHNPSRDELVMLCGAPEEGVHEDLTSNLLTTAGLTRLTNLLTGGGAQAASATAARLGVGNSATTALVADTDLNAASGAGNRQFYVMDATYPTVAAGVLTVRSTFATGDANFVWNEWGIDIGTPTVANGTTVNACLLNHKIASLGTKASGSAWALTATITLS
jgi:hypothetical protein